jgi:DNA-3-methyladenine glycosylase I
MWEMLTLEGFQEGLSWLTILRERDAFRDFDPAKVARFNESFSWWAVHRFLEWK